MRALKSSVARERLPVLQALTEGYQAAFVVGTIFGVLRKESDGEVATEADFLRPGRELVAVQAEYFCPAPAVPTSADQALFAIVQGGDDARLREASAVALAGIVVQLR